jgi:hypothetical protein
MKNEDGANEGGRTHFHRHISAALIPERSGDIYSRMWRGNY